jgi:enoyl-CoA hydratase/carnithine racemase
MTGTVTVERQDNVLIATLVNPPMALMDDAMVAKLHALSRQADTDRTVGGVVLTGGHPTRFLAHFDVRAWWPWSGCSRCCCRSSRARRCGSRPSTGTPAVVAASSPWHVTCASWRTDRPYGIGQPEIFLGFSPGGGGTQRLTRLLGPSGTLAICLDGGPLTPTKALAIGLVDRIIASEDLLEESFRRAAYLGRRPKLAIGAVKRSVHTGGSLPLTDGLRFEAAEFIAGISTPESITAQRAYIARMEELGDVPIADPETVAAVVERGRFV